MGASFTQASTYNLVRSLDNQPSRVPLLGAAAGVEVNLPGILEAAARERLRLQRIPGETLSTGTL